MVLYQKTFNIGLNKWDELGVEVDNFYTLKEVHWLVRNIYTDGDE
ncbi:hypothetical protein [uncultured Clostridium sp.]|nr:hypothetical protein [uncultured Clostridium sp.]